MVVTVVYIGEQVDIRGVFACYSDVTGVLYDFFQLQGCRKGVTEVLHRGYWEIKGFKGCEIK